MSLVLKEETNLTLSCFPKGLVLVLITSSHLSSIIHISTSVARMVNHTVLDPSYNFPVLPSSVSLRSARIKESQANITLLSLLILT